MAERLDPPDPTNIPDRVIADTYVELKRAQRDIDEATGRKRAILKRAKASGVEIDQLQAAIKLTKQAPDDAQAQLRTRLRYVGIIAPHMQLTQANLFGDELAPLQDAPFSHAAVVGWEAEEQGYAAGMSGGSVEDTDHPPGSDEYTRFLDGFARGQALMRDLKDEHTKIASTARAKPRGKSAAGNDDTETIADARQTDIEDGFPPVAA